MNNVTFFALDKNFDLAKKLADKFEKKLIIPEIVTFGDGEVRIDLPEGLCVEGRSIFIIYSTVDPVNVSYIKLFFLIDLLRRNGACGIKALIPYFGYARQCFSKNGKDVGHAKTIANLLECAGATSVSVVEMHDHALQSFFIIDFYNILLKNFIADHIKKTFADLENYCLIAVDKGASERIKDLAKLLHINSFFFSKKRSDINHIEIIDMGYGCSLTGKHAIIIDDIIDTGSTALKATDKLFQLGVSKIYAYFIHPVLSDNAAQKLEKSAIEKIFVTNTIQLQESKKINKIEVFDISNALLKALSGRI